MLRFLARFFGLWLVAGALVALVVDGARSIASGEFIWTSLVGLWEHVAPATLDAARAAAEDNAPAWVWDPLIASLLALPAFAAFLALGALLLWAGQKTEAALTEFSVR